VSNTGCFEVTVEVWHVFVVLQDFAVILLGAFGWDGRVGETVSGDQLDAGLVETVQV
jgi:hypothetical protein